MRKNYWKECCLILIGIFLGTLYERYFNSLPVKQTIINIKKDTIDVRDTTLVLNTIVPMLNEKTVLAELIKQGVPHANIVLAQSKLETGHYTSELSKTHNNIFGLRKGNDYRKYNTYSECISDYKRLISSKYKGGDYYQFLQNLGYAADEEYIIKLKKIV